MPNDVLPPGANIYILRLSSFSQALILMKAWVIRYISLWGTFLIQTFTLCILVQMMAKLVNNKHACVKLISLQQLIVIWV